MTNLNDIDHLRQSFFYNKMKNVLKIMILLTVIIVGSGCIPDKKTPTEPEDDNTTTPVSIDPIIIDWIKQNAFNLETTSPDSIINDLLFLNSVVGEKRFVVYGETTYGAHEFIEMKHRLFKYLVVEKDFNVFAIEGSWAGVERLNRYIQTGSGDPVSILDSLNYWPMKNQEMLDLIDWMYEHNLNPGSSPRVSFYGFDIFSPVFAMDNVVEYLSTVDESMSLLADSLYGHFRIYDHDPVGYYLLDSETKEICKNQIIAVYDSLINNRSIF